MRVTGSNDFSGAAKNVEHKNTYPHPRRFADSSGTNSAVILVAEVLG
jgi:hypothetical protein